MNEQLTLGKEVLLAHPADRAYTLVEEAGFYNQWRYLLSMGWDLSKKKLVFVMMNPSDDKDYKKNPSVRRCCRIAEEHGYGGIRILNLFAFRSMHPQNFLGGGKTEEHKHVGPETDDYIREFTKDQYVVFAWGSSAPDWRIKEVKEMVEATGTFCLAKTKDGKPMHPIANLAGKRLINYYK